jgi:23S rRNA (uridine2552-2'-O)-methyltransferase
MPYSEGFMVRITNNSLSKSSKAWLKEHMEDAYVQRAQKDGYRARAAYKLLEIQEKDRVFRPGMTVVDLGSAPGSWSQVASKLVGPAGQVLASDILPMDALPGVRFIQGDFREEEVLAELLAATGGRPVDLLISDMAPNISGTMAADVPRAMHLCDLALDMASRVLKPGGAFVVKVFQGEGFESYRQAIQQQFGVLKSRKPAASRPRSRELYLVAKDFRG